MGLLTGMSFLSVFEILFWLLRLPQKNNDQDVLPMTVSSTKIPIHDAKAGSECSITDIE